MSYNLNNNERTTPMASHTLNDQQKSNTKNAHPTPQHSAVEPSGPLGDDPSTAGPGNTAVQSKTPENNLGHINPSAPEDANITPGTAGNK
jgi:hypothetical protein